MMTYKNFTLETDSDGIALVTWDSPGKSMNVIDQTVLDEWNAIIDKAAADEAIKGVVLTSGKKTFGAGADLTMLEKMMDDTAELAKTDKEGAAKLMFENASAMNGILRKQETCGKPFVAAINGQALGEVEC